MKTNVKTKVATPALTTAEGGRAVRINAEKQLRRSVLTYLLWENTFYQDGTSVADRIKDLVPKVQPEKVAAIAVEAREEQKLRHAPLYIVSSMVKSEKHKPFVADTLSKVIQRPDELSEFLSIYWKGGKTPIANQVKKGLAKAFTKFDEYSLAKYNQDNAIKLRDVLFLCHAKPLDAAQEKLWKKLVDGKLETPDTWEVELSAKKGEGKKESWTRLLQEGKLLAMALLRNLRNMMEAGVDDSLIRDALKKCKADRVLPFRFITAARYAPKFEPELEQLMFKCLKSFEKLLGRTALIVDVSGSMNSKVSSKSELMRLDAASGVAMLLREICDSVDVYTFSDHVKEVPARHGFALAEAIDKSQPHSGTHLSPALDKVRGKYDRVIVITDEQAHTSDHSVPADKNYLINISCEKNGIGYGKWVHLDGWSESIVKWIVEDEKFSDD